MRRFPGEGEARSYLEQHVPTTEQQSAGELTALKQPLFPVADFYAAGRYEYDGPESSKLTFEVRDGETSFHTCYDQLRGLLGAGEIVGDLRPIYTIHDFQLTTAGGQFDQKTTLGYSRMFWLPNLHGRDPSASSNYVHLDQRQIFLLGNTGRFASPEHLLSFFHEIGHLQTRPPEQLQDEYDDLPKVTITGSGVIVPPSRPVIDMAQELQRERDANAWLLRSTSQLFEAMNIPRPLIQRWVHHQLQSYERNGRDVLDTTRPGSKG